MRSYNKIKATVWSGETGRLLKQHSETARLLQINMFSNERAMAEPWGLYYYPRAAIADALNASPAKVTSSLESLATVGYAYYDGRTEWVWVVRMAAEQVLTDGKALAPKDNMVLAANKWYARCPKNPYLGPFFDLYVRLLHLEERRDGGEPQAVTVGAHQPLLLGEGPVPKPVTSIAERRVGEFDVFWAAYHAKGKSSKVKAREEWMKRKPTAVEVMVGLDRWKASQRWQDGYVVDAARFIKEERWLEYPEQSLAPGMSERTRDVVEALTTEGSIFDLERPPGRALKEG